MTTTTGTDTTNTVTRGESALFRIIMWGGLMGLLVSVVGGAIYTGYWPPKPKGAPAGEPPVLQEVPVFTFTERSGKEVSRSDLRGKVWIADFIFTNCGGPCPILTKHMKGLQNELESYGDRIQLVSFTMDPLRDTPARLQYYAGLYGADTERWWFLTCENETKMHMFITNGFLQTVQPESEDNPIIHSNYFALVDSSGRIRGFYDVYEDAAAKRRLIADVESLLKNQ